MTRKWLVRFGRVIAGLVTILALFHAIENFRGARAWETERQRLEAKGEELNWAKLTLPTMSSNDPAGSPSHTDLVNWKSPDFLAVPGLKPDFAGLWVPRGPDGRIEIEKWRTLLLKPSAATKPETPCEAGRSFLEAIGTIEPTIKVLVEAARIGPIADWGTRAREEPWYFPPLMQIHRLSRILQARIAAHFSCSESQRAIGELRLMARLHQSLHRLPFTTATSWEMALGQELLDAAQDGLTRGELAEGHRREIASLLSDDWIESARMGIRTHRNWTIYAAETPESNRRRKNFDRYLEMVMLPHGWRLRWAIHMSGTADQVLHLIENPQRIDPAAIDGLSHWKGERRTPYNSIALSTEHLFRSFAKAGTALQTRVQLVRTAFALQLFREKTGAFPETLASLAPTYLAAVPTDIVNGQPLRYRATPQGALLYSVGWDLKDEKGFSPPNLPFVERPDWAVTVGAR